MAHQDSRPAAWIDWLLLIGLSLLAGWASLYITVTCISGVGAKISGGAFGFVVVCLSLILGGLLWAGCRRHGRFGAARFSTPFTPVIVLIGFYLWHLETSHPEPIGPDWCYTAPYQDQSQ